LTLEKTPSHPHKDTLVVIPARNEAANIADLAGRCALHAKVLVVDDHSTDDTARAAAGVKGVSCIPNTGEPGIRHAVLAGLAHAVDRGFSRVVTMDAGGSHDPEEIPGLIRDASAADMVLTRRVKKPGCPPSRKLLSAGAAAYFNVLVRVKAPGRVPWVHDPTSGFRLYSAPCARRLLSASFVSTMHAFHLEALFHLLAAGRTFVERPITYRYSSSSLGLSAFADSVLAAVRLAAARGGPPASG